MANLIDYFARNPRKLFLLDGIGAAATAFSLFVVSRVFSGSIGVSVDVLAGLAAVAVLYCAYSLACWLLLRAHWGLYLRIISMANAVYCLSTAALIAARYADLTVWGLLYFGAEIGIIAALVYVEIKVAHALSGSKHNVSSHF